MLTMMSGAITFGAVMAAAELQGGSGLEFVVGVLLATGLGLLAMAAAHVGGERAFRHFRLEGDSPRANARLRAIYFAKMAWVLVAPVLGFMIADGVLRAAFP